MGIQEVPIYFEVWVNAFQEELVVPQVECFEKKIQCNECPKIFLIFYKNFQTLLRLGAC